MCKNRDRIYPYVTLRTSHMQKKWGHFHVRHVSHSAGAQLLRPALPHFSHLLRKVVCVWIVEVVFVGAFV